MVNNREYQTRRAETSEHTAKEAAAVIAYNICRDFSANDGMYPTGFAHDGVIQGRPIPVGSGRHTYRPAPVQSGRHANRSSDSSLDSGSYRHYDSAGSRSGGSSPEQSNRPPYSSSRTSRHTADDPPARHTMHSRRHNRHI